MISRKKSDHSFEPSQKEEFAAKIECLNKKIRFVRENTTINIPVEITNESKNIFPLFTQNEKNPVNLSYHWLDDKKNVVEFNGKRTFLPYDLDPNEKITLEAMVMAPNKPGDYYLEFDLVKENIAWFKDKKSTSLLIPIKVLAKDYLSLSFWFPDIEEHLANFSHIVGGTKHVSFSGENPQILDIDGWPCFSEQTLASRTPRSQSS